MTDHAGTRALVRVRAEAQRQGYQREPEGARLGNLAAGKRAAKNRRELQLVGDLFQDLYHNKSVARKMLLPKINENWQQIVGDLVAEHTKPIAFSDNVLQVSANSSVWAVQLSSLSHVLATKIAEITGYNEPISIKVNGPKANVPKYGPRTVKGARGYRDTFG